MACRNNSESMQVSYIVQIITQIVWNRYINIKIPQHKKKSVNTKESTNLPKLKINCQKKKRGMREVYTKQTLQIDQKVMTQKLLKTQGRTRGDDFEGKVTSNINNNSTTMSVSVQTSEFIVRNIDFRVQYIIA